MCININDDLKDHHSVQEFRKRHDVSKSEMTAVPVGGKSAAAAAAWLVVQDMAGCVAGYTHAASL